MKFFDTRAAPRRFCAFDGEDGTDGAEESENAFNNKAPWKRIIVLISGPLMNYALALLLIIVSMFAFGQMVFRIGGVQEFKTEEEAAIYREYSFEENDLILKVEGKTVYLVTDMMNALNGKKQGENVTFLVNRGGEEVETVIKLREDCNFESSSQVSRLWRAVGLGTVIREEGEYWNVFAENYRYSFLETLGNSFVYSFKVAGTIFQVLGELLTGKLSLTAMGGPVTTIKLTSQIAAQKRAKFL